MRTARLIYAEMILTGLALLVIWQVTEVRRAGYRLERIERRVEERAAQVQRYRAHVERLQSPQRVLPLVESLGIPLELARETAICSRESTPDDSPERFVSGPGEPPPAPRRTVPTEPTRHQD